MSYVVGTGSFLPNRNVSNSDLAEMLNDDAESIFGKTGIRNRRWADSGTTTTELAAEAVLSALADAGLKTTDLDYLIVGTMTPDRFIPGDGGIVQSRLGLNAIPCLDIRNACCNGLYGLQLGSALIGTEKVEHLAICCSEIQSRYLNLQPVASNISMLFGDAASCIILAPKPTKGALRVLDVIIHSDGQYADALGVRSPGVAFENPGAEDYLPRMDGRTVITHALRSLEQIILELLSRNALSNNDVEWVVPHQANANLFRELARRLDYPLDRIVSVIEETGNTSSASMGLALDHLRRTNTLSEGALIVLPAFAAGFSWGAALLQAVHPGEGR